MRNLIAVAYDDVDTAKDVMRAPNALSVEHAIRLDEGETRLREALNVPAR